MPSPERSMRPQLLLILQYAEGEGPLNSNTLVAHINRRFKQSRPGQSSILLMSFPVTSDLTGYTDRQTTLNTPRLSFAFTRHSIHSPETDDGGGLPSTNMRWWALDGAASRASMAMHSFLVLDHFHLVEKKNCRHYSHIIDIHQKSSTDARRVTVVHADAQQHGDGCIDCRSTEIENSPADPSREREGERWRLEEDSPADFGRFFGIGCDSAMFASHERRLAFESIVLDAGKIDLEL